MCAAAGLGLSVLLCSLPAAAQDYPVTPQQRAVAQATAQTGIPEGELAPNAPDVYVVKRGDTLWDISGLYLLRPWRWPELWGMNLAEIRNPHRIYPGQTLYLERTGGRARLRTSRPGGDAGLDGGTVRVSPATRYGSLADSALATLRPQFIDPFLAEPLVVDAASFDRAPRLVATLDDRVLLARGDRAYARSAPNTGPMTTAAGQPHDFRVFRNTVPLKDPATGEILGYEAQYVGQARLLRGETTQSTLRDGKQLDEIVPASLDIVGSKEEMRVGDRLLPEPAPMAVSYVPRAPEVPVDNARVVSIYGSAVANGAQSQVVAINKGTRDGIESGHVLAILSEGARIVDKTDPSRASIKLPDERNGLLMVFRPFERVSYALILDIRTGVKVGDRLVLPD
ncbi:LysM domain-containing protein [uncultured Xylophilus sp.]|uniref:LysM peptidoglycan-binding domain-containing protein n=1 Tax=uncultured Xylophilus sp. TaxID=296832 RepID=UPI0025E0769B|nr:LysM domain-containing protein [uncultured Xylophilus sp.]